MLFKTEIMPLNQSGEYMSAVPYAFDYEQNINVGDGMYLVRPNGTIAKFK